MTLSILRRKGPAAWMRKKLQRQPLVSVILPSFNHASYVAEAVASVLDQSMADLELIVVDDASTDDTPDIVAGFDDPRLRLLRMESNRAVHPRNLALSMARGRYVAFQNSDDVWLPGKLERQVEAMAAKNAPSVCFTQTALIGADGRPSAGSWAEDIFDFTERSSIEWLRHFFEIGNCLSIASAMLRRQDLVELGGFRASLVQVGDFDLWIRMAARGAFLTLPETLTLYRIHGANLSAPSPTAGPRALLELSQLFERYTASPILERLPEIFPDIPSEAGAGARKVCLALHALTKERGAVALFADRVIAAVLDDAQERADAVAHHGTAFIHDFIARRGRSEFRTLPHA